LPVTDEFMGHSGERQLIEIDEAHKSL
jgi:hypothetical protein